MADYEDSYRRYYPQVLAYIRRRTNNQVSEDLCAEVFTRAWQGWPPTGKVLPWLYGIARNVVLEFYRERERDENLTSAATHSFTSAASAEDSVAGQLDILRALSRLSDSDQEILRLHTWELLTPDELAITLDISAAAARVRLHRARKRLAVIMEEGATL